MLRPKVLSSDTDISRERPPKTVITVAKVGEYTPHGYLTRQVADIKIIIHNNIIVGLKSSRRT